MRRTRRAGRNSRCRGARGKREGSETRRRAGPRRGDGRKTVRAPGRRLLPCERMVRGAAARLLVLAAGDQSQGFGGGGRGRSQGWGTQQDEKHLPQLLVLLLQGLELVEKRHLFFLIRAGAEGGGGGCRGHRDLGCVCTACIFSEYCRNRFLTHIYGVLYCATRYIDTTDIQKKCSNARRCLTLLTLGFFVILVR